MRTAVAAHSAMFTGIHVLALILDSYVHFGLVEVLVPFTMEGGARYPLLEFVRTSSDPKTALTPLGAALPARRTPW